MVNQATEEVKDRFFNLHNKLFMDSFERHVCHINETLNPKEKKIRLGYAIDEFNELLNNMNENSLRLNIGPDERYGSYCQTYASAKELLEERVYFSCESLSIWNLIDEIVDETKENLAAETNLEKIDLLKNKADEASLYLESAIDELITAAHYATKELEDVYVKQAIMVKNLLCSKFEVLDLNIVNKKLKCEITLRREFDRGVMSVKEMCETYGEKAVDALYKRIQDNELFRAIMESRAKNKNNNDNDNGDNDNNDGSAEDWDNAD